MKKQSYFLAAFFLLMLSSCTESEFNVYQEGARIQFGPEYSKIYNPAYNLLDTTKYQTFFYSKAEATQDTVFFDVYAIGGISTVDRAFTLQQEQLAGVTNAEEGVDYKAFTDNTVSDKYLFKAGQVHTLIPIVLLRSAKQKTTTLTLKFKLVADANFQLGEANSLWRKVIFTDRVSQPAAWNVNYSSQFGSYSVVKHSFMIQTTGETWDQNFIVVTFKDYSATFYYKNLLKTALVDYNIAHPGNPLKDENGALVVFP